MHVKKLIVLVYANKTLYYILLENFGGSSPPPPLPFVPDYNSLSLSLFLYIYIERERERERESKNIMEFCGNPRLSHNNSIS